MSGEESGSATTATLLEELRRSRLATEALVQEFSTFKTDTNAKLSLLELENDKLRKKEGSDDEDDLVYCEHSRSENPFPNRPRNCTIKPQPFDLYGDRTADLLEQKTNSSLRWEYRVLAPTLAYLYDAKIVYDSVKDDVYKHCPEEVGLSVEAALNTIDGCYDMLAQRYATIKIRTRAEAEPGGLSEENKLLLDYLDTKLHGIFPGEALVDSKVEAWLSDYRDKRAAAELKNAVSTGQKGKKVSYAATAKDSGSDGASASASAKSRNQAKRQGVKPKPKAA